ncbi:Uncharacterised protein [Chromobacterium vaccinii]|nr:Uncharacterised protein [Chromobacterium vaccinii]
MASIGIKGSNSEPDSLRERNATHSARKKLTPRLTRPINATPAHPSSTADSGTWKSSDTLAKARLADENVMWRMSSGRPSIVPTVPVRPRNMPK